jgi:hypothetical protein
MPYQGHLVLKVRPSLKQDGEILFSGIHHRPKDDDDDVIIMCTLLQKHEPDCGELQRVVLTTS